MKKFIASVVVLMMATCSFAQFPHKMSYQAVIRNSGNALVTNQAVGMRISILKGSADGPVVYIEFQTPTTNSNGLISIEIGGEEGYSLIDWTDGPYFIKTETDPSGGTNYGIVGTSQLLSVPYALHSKTTENYTETDPVFSTHPVNGITSSSINDWDNAYNWGNHANAGYGSFNLPSLTAGSILFSNGTTISQDNVNLYWDNTNKRLGIGNTSPSFKLDITGNSRITDQLTVKSMNFTPGTYEYFAYMNGSNFLYNNNGHVQMYGILRIYTNAGQSLTFNNQANVIFNSGNVGIGITAPGAKLDVNGVIKATGGNSDNWNSSFTWGDHAAAGYFKNGGENGGTNRFLGNTDNYSLSLITDNSSRIFIGNTGNVGIGTDVPTQKLEVAGIAQISNQVYSPFFNALPGTTNGNSVTIQAGRANGGFGSDLQSSGGSLNGGNVKIEGGSANHFGQGGNVEIIAGDAFDTGSKGGSILLKAKGYSNWTQGYIAFFTGGSYSADVNKPIERMRLAGSGNLGIGTSSPDASAIVEMSSTTRGFLPPRMTKTQRDAISPVAGLMIYNLSTNKPNFYDGTTWQTFDGTPID